MYSILILCGDIEVNPGPKWRFPYKVKCNQKGLQCDRCDQWYHTRCCLIDDQTYNSLADTSSYLWICSSCDIPNFSSSLFSSSIKAASSSFDPLVDLEQKRENELSLAYEREPYEVLARYGHQVVLQSPLGVQ